jgi:hypothetical protein
MTTLDKLKLEYQLDFEVAVADIRPTVVLSEDSYKNIYDYLVEINHIVGQNFSQAEDRELMDKWVLRNVGLDYIPLSFRIHGPDLGLNNLVYKVNDAEKLAKFDKVKLEYKTVANLGICNI